MKGQAAVVRLLLEHRASLEAKDRYGPGPRKGGCGKCGRWRLWELRRFLEVGNEMLGLEDVKFSRMDLRQHESVLTEDLFISVHNF
eukprot:Skav220578  [mRNA]  locus=scaffold145:186836:187093:- [translate_table: standard]